MTDDSVVITVSHLALRTLEDSIRQHVVADRRGDGRWDVLMSSRLAEALTVAAEEEGMTVSDYIISLHRRPAGFIEGDPVPVTRPVP